MKQLILIGLCVLMVAPTAARGDDQLKFSTEVRQRLEVDNRDFNSDTGVRTYNLLRTRFGATFMASEDVSAFIQLQDSRVWGEEASTLGDGSANFFDLHQGYFLVQNLFEKPADLKVGRMEFNLGPQRLIGAVGWDNVGRAFDGAILSGRHGKHAVHLFSFTEVDSLKIEDQKDRFLHGAYADIHLADDYTTQVFWIWQRWVPREMMNRHTLGFYAARKGRFHHETEFAYQLGDITAGGMKQDVQAFMAALNLGYAFPDATWTPDVTAGVDYLSGDDNTGDTDYKVFDTLYATNHKYYGYMDYFLNIPVNTFGLGLIDYHGRVSVTPVARTTFKADYHYFASAQDFQHLNEQGENDPLTSFGNEVDLTLAHQYSENMSFTAGASFFAPGDIFKAAKGEDSSTWFYLMTAFAMK